MLLPRKTKHPDLISWFSCSYTLNLTASTCKEKKANHYLLMKETVKLNHLSTPFYVDFWSLPQGVPETPAHWFKCIQKVQNNKTIQNNIYCWIETTQIKIEESPQSKFYNNIRDLSIRSFWYHNSDTKRNPWVMLCSHFPINDSSGYLHNTVYLAVMSRASWHTAEGN